MQKYLVCLLAATVCAVSGYAASDREPVDYVDMFIGTSNS